MNKRTLSFIIFAFASIFITSTFFSCSDTGYAVSEITLDKQQIVMAKGESATISASIEPQKAKTNIIIWSILGKDKDKFSLSSVKTSDGESVTITANDTGTVSLKATAACIDSEICSVNAKKSLTITSLPSDGVIVTGDDEVLTFEGFKAILALTSSESSNVSLDFSEAEISTFGEGTQESPIIPITAKLSSLVLPKGLTRVGSYFAYNNANLNDVTFSENLSAIAIYAFSSCSSLKTVTIPSTVKNIEFETPTEGSDQNKMTSFKCCTTLTKSAKVALTKLGYKNPDGSDPF